MAEHPTELPRPLTPRETAAALHGAVAAIRAEVAALPAAWLRWHPAPGEWCALEVLGHLIEAESRGFAGRVRLLLREDEPALRTWDPAAVARERRDCERAPAALLDELGRLREASVALVASLREADLGRGGRHPAVGHLRIADVLAEWVHHDRHHVRQLLAGVQGCAWPHLGNARRFSSPSG